MKKMLFAGALVCALLAVVACKNDGASTTADDDHHSDFPSCQAIIDVCHEVDVGEGEVNRCHELAHEATSDETCAAQKTSCVATCRAAADGGVADAAGDGG